MSQLAEQIRELVDGAALPITQEEVQRREATPPVSRISVAHARGYGSHVRFVAAGVLVLALLLAGGLIVASRTGQARRTAGPNRVHVVHWQLTASLSGSQFQLGTGNPGSISQVNCGGGSTCFLSTFYGVGGNTALTGSTYVSHDGGATWAPVTLPAGVAAATPVSCVSATWCAAGGGFLDPASGDPAAKKEMRDPELLVTSDGGATWTMYPLPIPPDVQQLPAYGSLPAETTYWPAIVDAVACTAVDVCNVTAHVLNSNANSSGLIPDTLVFLRTTDGGSTWSQTDLPERASEAGFEVQVPDGNQDSLACPTASTCIAVSLLRGFVGNGVVDAWRTSDSGASWEETQVSDAESVFPGLSCSDVHDCWLTDGAEALHSTDGGATWSTVKLPEVQPLSDGLPGPSWQSISCTSATSCFIGGPGIDSTTDGGRSWAAVALPPQVGDVQSISCQVRGPCIALANPEQLAKSPLVPNGSSLVLTSGAPSTS
jgi:photosystem II stability/assembly factor-like uncharacterized protein